MSTLLTRTQLRVLAVLFMHARTTVELNEHWPRARKTLRWLQRRGYVSFTDEVWTITLKGEELWNNRLTKKEA